MAEVEKSSMQLKAGAILIAVIYVGTLYYTTIYVLYSVSTDDKHAFYSAGLGDQYTPAQE